MPEKPPKAVTRTQKKVAEICDKAIEAIQQKVLAHFQKHPDSAWSGHYLVDLEKTIKAVYQDMGIDIGRSFKSGLSENMQAMYDKAVEDLKTSGRRNAILGKPNERLIRNYMESSFDEIAMRTQKMSFDHVRALRSMSADVLRTAALTGASRAEVTKEFLARAQEIPGFKFTAANGAQWTNKAYFTMLARTELMQAGRAAYDQKCADEGCDVVELDYSGNCCDACARWEGKQFSLTGATKGLPTKADLEADGVFHPNCTHRYSAVANWDAVREAAEEARKEDEAEEAKRREEEQAARAQQAPAKQEEAAPAPARRRQADNGPARSSSPQASDKAMKAAEDKARRDTEAQAREMAAQSDEQQAEAAKQQAEEKRKAQEKVKAQIKKAIEDEMNSEHMQKAIAEAERKAAEDADRKGLSGKEREEYIDNSREGYKKNRRENCERIGRVFDDEIQKCGDKMKTTPTLVFDEKAENTHYVPGKHSIHVMSEEKDTGLKFLKWNQTPGQMRHEVGHALHLPRVDRDLETVRNVKSAAAADWENVQAYFDGSLDSLKREHVGKTIARLVYDEDLDKLTMNQRHSVGLITDTIGSIANGHGYGFGHEDKDYQAQNITLEAHAEAVASVHSLKNADDRAKLYLKELFPNLLKATTKIDGIEL